MGGVISANDDMEQTSVIITQFSNQVYCVPGVFFIFCKASHPYIIYAEMEA